MSIGGERPGLHPSWDGGAMACRRGPPLKESGRGVPTAKEDAQQHHPGARSARRGRCPSTLTQTTRRDLIKFRNSAASLALAFVAALGIAGPAAAGDQV